MSPELMQVLTTIAITVGLFVGAFVLLVLVVGIFVIIGE